ncbi:hypothetical protein [Pyramidobacter sp.]|uniref:hypothetical protein n=1 Tax=Pyramidobacter sp. TaxID=1943581 RepID=UPI00331C0A6B
MADKKKNKEIVLDAKNKKDRDLLKDLMFKADAPSQTQPPPPIQAMEARFQQEQHILESGITSPDPLVVMLGSSEIFGRMDKYDHGLAHQMFELFIAKQQASVDFVKAQTEAVKSLPRASEREYVITTRGQWLGVGCVVLGLAASCFLAWLGHIKTAGVVAVAISAPNLISTFINPRHKKQQEEPNKSEK